VRAAVDRRSVVVRNALRRVVRSLPTTVIRRRRRVHMWYGRAGACVRGRRSILLCSAAVVRPQPKGEDGCNNDGAGWRGGGIGGDERVTSVAGRRRFARVKRPRRLCNGGCGDAMFSFRRASLIYLFFLLLIHCKTSHRPLVIFDRSARF